MVGTHQPVVLKNAWLVASLSPSPTRCRGVLFIPKSGSHTRATRCGDSLFPNPGRTIPMLSTTTAAQPRRAAAPSALAHPRHQSSSQCQVRRPCPLPLTTADQWCIDVLLWWGNQRRRRGLVPRPENGFSHRRPASCTSGGETISGVGDAGA
jgi:hypothetical protein